MTDKTMPYNGQVDPDGGVWVVKHRPAYQTDDLRVATYLALQGVTALGKVGEFYGFDAEQAERVMRRA